MPNDSSPDDTAVKRSMRRQGRVRGLLIGVRLQPDLLRRLDEVRTGTDWTRPEAMRLILRAALTANDNAEPEDADHVDADAA